jgi:hypothetical protein
MKYPEEIGGFKLEPKISTKKTNTGGPKIHFTLYDGLEKAAYIKWTHDETKFQVLLIKIEEDYQRKGLGTLIYDELQRINSVPLEWQLSDVQSSMMKDFVTKYLLDCEIIDKSENIIMVRKKKPMSNISSNSLFHFTPRKENLLSILDVEFLPKYCFEEIQLATSGHRERLSHAIPMVCFCDISLSQIHNHIEEYGSYGIGMTKEWGIRNGLNPMIYLNADSNLSLPFNVITEDIYQLLGEHCTNRTKNVFDELMNIMNFLKPYDGCSRKDGEKTVRFYDEKEWRYIPKISFDHPAPNSLSTEEFKNEETLGKANDQMDLFKLSFTPNDIKYIFIKSESEIHEFVRAIRNVKGPRFSKKEVDILTTKIITVEQLSEDF